MHGLGKRTVFAGIVLAGLWVLAEGCAFLAFFRIDGRTFTWSRLLEEERKVGGKSTVQALGDLLARQTRRGTEYLHPYLGFFPLPEDLPKTEGIECLWIFDQAAYVFDSPLYRRREDTAVVAVTGGSVAYLFMQSGARLLQERLQSAPDFSARKILFVAICTGGFKQPQQMFGIEYLLALGAQFDLVINIDGFNEVALHEAENIKRDVFPIYPRNWFNRFQGPPEFLPRMGEISYLRLKRVHVAARAERSWWRWSVLHHLLWKLRDLDFERDLLAKEEEFRNLKPQAGDVRITGPSLRFEDRSQLYDHLVDLWERCSRELHLLCLSHGIRYYHFLQPNQYFEGSKPLSEEEIETAWLEKSEFRKGVIAGYPKLIERGRKLQDFGVGFHDLSGIFAEVSESLYIDNCCHFNERGNQILAEAIAAAILTSR